MTVTTRLITAAELEQQPQSDSHVELVQGVIVTMPPAGHEHGGIAAYLTIRLGEFVVKHRLGKVYAAETGFILSRNPDTVRAPDVAFVSTARLAQQLRKAGFFDAAPDLAVEVVSPGDTVVDVEEKVIDYLNARTRLVWIVHPRTRSFTVYRSLNDVRVLTAADTLDGGDVLPGLSITVRDCFD